MKHPKIFFTITISLFFITLSYSQKYIYVSDLLQLANCRTYECADTWIRMKGYNFVYSHNETDPMTYVRNEYSTEHFVVGTTWFAAALFYSILEENDKIIGIVVEYRTAKKQYFELAKSSLKKNGFIYSKMMTEGDKINIKYTSADKKMVASLDDILDVNSDNHKNRVYHLTIAISIE